jgi:hypothetical protein
MARLLVLGCWCYKEHRLLGWVLSSKILAKTTDAEVAVAEELAVGALKDVLLLVRLLSCMNPTPTG